MMTVIAYRDGLLAADTLMATNDRKGYTQKLFRHNWESIAVCGDFARALEMLEWYKAGADLEKFPAKRDDQDFARLIVVCTKGLRVYENGPCAMWHSESFIAYGSGADFAMGAMYMGATAVEACEAAIKWCTSCGGEIQTLKIRQ